MAVLANGRDGFDWCQPGDAMQASREAGRIAVRCAIQVTFGVILPEASNASP